VYKGCGANAAARGRVDPNGKASTNRRATAVDGTAQTENRR